MRRHAARRLRLAGECVRRANQPLDHPGRTRIVRQTQVFVLEPGPQSAAALCCRPAIRPSRSTGQSTPGATEHTVAIAGRSRTFCRKDTVFMMPWNRCSRCRGVGVNDSVHTHHPQAPATPHCRELGAGANSCFDRSLGSTHPDTEGSDCHPGLLPLVWIPPILADPRAGGNHPATPACTVSRGLKGPVSGSVAGPLSLRTPYGGSFLEWRSCSSRVEDRSPRMPRTSERRRASRRDCMHDL